MIDPFFIVLVNQLKAVYPCSTVSLDRTPERNRIKRGAKQSWHLSTTEGGAKAIDLIFDDQASLVPAAQYATGLGFGGIEIDFRNNHLHLDLRPIEIPWHVVYIGKETLTLDEYLTRLNVPV